MINLEEFILWEEDRIDEKVTDIKSIYEKDKGEKIDNDDIEILKARL